MKKRFPLLTFLLFFTLASFGQNQFSFKRDSSLQGKLGLFPNKHWSLPLLSDSLELEGLNFYHPEKPGPLAFLNSNKMPIFEPKGKHSMPVYEPDTTVAYKMRIFKID